MTKEERIEIIKRQMKAQRDRKNKPIIKNIEEIDAKVKIVSKEEEKKEFIEKKEPWTEVVKRGKKKSKTKEEENKNKTRSKSTEREKTVR